MTTNVPAVDVHGAAAEARPKNFINWSSGFMSWAGTLDHKRIGLMYLVGVSIAFLCGGLFALLVRLHLWEPNGALFSNAQYNQIFTLHGAFMVFIFVIPAIPGLAREHHPAAHARRQGRGAAAPQPAELLPVAHRRGPRDAGHRARRLRHRLDVLHALQPLHEPGGRHDRPAVFVLGFSSIFTGLNFIVTCTSCAPRA
jgi:cytochrome c oxidase subunit 1